MSEIQRRLVAQSVREQAPPAPAVRPGALSYTAIALHDACPRRSRYHYVLGLPDLSDEAPPIPGDDDHREPTRRDPARFGRIVHLVLESVMLARIGGEEPEIDRYLDEAMDEEGCAEDHALRSEALAAIDAAVAELSTLTPIDAEQRFDLEIAGVALSGFIDLLARDDRGHLVVVDYKTGTTPAAHYAMQFALYRHAVARSYPEDTQTLLLRIANDRATLEPIVPSSEGDLANAVAQAQAMDSDEPRPGVQCRTCPYAFTVCDAAPLQIAS